MAEYEIVALMQATSDVFKNEVLVKMTNPKRFKVSWSIGDVDLSHTLCDLGASINLKSLYL